MSTDEGDADHRRHPLRVVLVSYEFTFSPFSGNGILSRSLVKSLIRQGCHVTVWCCRPDSCTENHHLQSPEIPEESLIDVVVTTIPQNMGWKRLDRGSAWRHFVYDSFDDENDRERLRRSVSTAHVVCVVDWNGSMAWESVSVHPEAVPPLLYLNFRVFGSGIADPEERKWYDAMERRALQRASFVVALSEKDKQSLCTLMEETKPVRVLLPPLRGDMKDLAHLGADDLQSKLPPVVALSLSECSSSRRRCLVTCVARISPEKNIENFCKFVKANRQVLDDCDLIPLLAGAAADDGYAARIKADLRNTAPHAIIVDSFLSPAALAAIFQRAALNVHPCEYDAYGMTIIEAGAFGVPSVVASQGSVGASVIVGDGASIEVNMSQANCWESVASLVQNEEYLRIVGEKARGRALAWDEDAYGKKLLEYLYSVLL